MKAAKVLGRLLGKSRAKPHKMQYVPAIKVGEIMGLLPSVVANGYTITNPVYSDDLMGLGITKHDLVCPSRIVLLRQLIPLLEEISEVIDEV